MGQPRQNKYIDVYLNDTAMRRLRKGYIAHVGTNGTRFAIHPKTNKDAEKIERLEAMIRKLKRKGAPGEKRVYVKKNKKFWADGGNVKHLVKGKADNA